MINKVKQYLGEVKSELNKVAWLTPQNLKKLTIIVILGTIIMGVVLGGFDVIFTEIKGLIK